MTKPIKLLWLTITILIFIIIILGLGWWLSGKKTMPKDGLVKQVVRKPIYWVAPMNPNYRSNKPGKSPMGMDLVPVFDKPDPAGTIKISPAVENNLGVRTETVAIKNFKQTIRTVGYVKPDENTIHNISVYTAGWVKDLQVKSTGESVKKRQLLLKLYSPVVVSAEEEYLLALKYKNQLLVKAGKQKLQTLGMSSKAIAQLSLSQKVEKNMPVYSPASGYVTQLQTREGQHVMPAKPLMQIASLSRVWVIAEVYERQAGLLKVGQSVSADFSAMPGKVITGKLGYIYPELNSKSRTVRVRTVFVNPQRLIKPGMYAHITIHAGHERQVIAIHKEALIQLGDSSRVVLALGDGKFKPVEVKVGQQHQNWVVIKSGLKPGERVVTSAQFLLDSESSLKAGLSRLSAKEEKADDADHDKMNHKQMGH